jgi:hypothetical protein
MSVARKALRLTYGPRGVLNDDNPNIGYDVHTGWDLN